ncbi:MAG: 50S ribosomal protein L17 [Fibrobacter sp.]|nr:50S ribosomal protein L17 [Fibrobacter sp.]
MRHRVKTKKLGANAKHKKSIINNMATSILRQGLAEETIDRQVKTTLTKAKIVRPHVERLITYAKKGDLAARRQAAKFVKDPEVLRELFDVIGPRYADRQGGYTRIMKLGPARKGDNAEMALIGLVEDTVVEKNKAPQKSENTSNKKIDIVGSEAVEEVKEEDVVAEAETPEEATAIETGKDDAESTEAVEETENTEEKTSE